MATEWPRRLARVFALASLALATWWSAEWLGGITLSASSAKLFNAHPPLMVLAFVVLTPEAALAIRRAGWRRDVGKPLHAYVQLASAVVAAVGLWAVFKYHANMGFPDLVSLHSWLGLLTVGLFAAQWVVGYACFYKPGAAPSARANFVPTHAAVGALLLVLIGATVVTGVMEKTIFVSSCDPGTKTECRVANLTALSALAALACTLYALVFSRSNSSNAAPAVPTSVDESSALLPTQANGSGRSASNGEVAEATAPTV